MIFPKTGFHFSGSWSAGIEKAPENRGPFHAGDLLRGVKGRQLHGALLRLLIVARRQERSRDQKQTHDTAQLGHGETPPVSPRAGATIDQKLALRA
jgi:hypothetical protein